MAGKAAIYDESNYPVSTPNSYTNFGYIDVLDESVKVDIQALLNRPNVHSMQELTAQQAKDMLTSNWYTEDPVKWFLLKEESTDLDGTVSSSVYLLID